MTQEDFYVLDQQSLQSRWEFACRLVSKLLSLRLIVTILVEDKRTAKEFDQMLWHYPPESFCPHVIANEKSPEPESGEDNSITSSDAVVISTSTVSKTGSVCINLRDQAPENHSVLTRLVEIVCQHPSVLSTTREKYKFYRQLNYPLQSHSINLSAL